MKRTRTASTPANGKAKADDCSGVRPALGDRPLLSFVDAVKVMALFKVLANDTRIRLLHHVVRNGEATVTQLGKALGMKPQAVSNQLQRLSDTRMLASRRDGNNVYYRVVNGCVAPLLDLALCLMDDEGKGGASRCP
jgi:DNA-binding transcriptional ArsR family regulator